MVDQNLTTTHGIRIMQAVAIMRCLRVPEVMQFELGLLAGRLDTVLWRGSTEGLREVRRDIRTLRDDPVLKVSVDTINVRPALEGVIELIMTP
jgi:hypothetical protein